MFVSMRLGPLVRLLCGVALIAVLVVGVLSAMGSAQQAPATTAPTTASSASAAAAVGPSVFRVARTQGDGLNMRGCAGTSCARVGWIAEGAAFTAGCSMIGSSVHGDRTWMRGTAHGQTGYVARYYLDPAGSLLPACGAKG